MQTRSCLAVLIFHCMGRKDKGKGEWGNTQHEIITTNSQEILGTEEEGETKLKEKLQISLQHRYLSAIPAELGFYVLRLKVKGQAIVGYIYKYWQLLLSGAGAQAQIRW